MADFVLDTSVAISWLFKDEESQYALDVLTQLSEQDVAFVPNLFFLEVCNVLLVGLKRNRLKDEDAREFLNLLSILPIKVFSEINQERVMDLGRKHNITSYDACYLALAIKFKVPIATLDTALKHGAIKEGVGVYFSKGLNQMDKNIVVV